MDLPQDRFGVYVPLDFKDYIDGLELKLFDDEFTMVGKWKLFEGKYHFRFPLPRYTPDALKFYMKDGNCIISAYNSANQKTYTFKSILPEEADQATIRLYYQDKCVCGEAFPKAEVPLPTV